MMKKNSYILLAYTILTFIFTFPLIFRMGSGIYGSFFGTDLRCSVWFLWWIKYAFVHHLNPSSCPFLNVPFGFELNNHVLFWFSSHISMWFGIFFGPIFSLNILAIFGFIFSGVFTYFLVFDFTKNRTAGFLSGVIFAFCPYHLNKIMEFGFSFYGCWLALYTTALLSLKQGNITFKKILGAGFFLALVIDFNAYYGFYAVIFSLGFLFFCWVYGWKEKIKDLLKKNNIEKFKNNILNGFILFASVVCIFFITLLLELPSVIPIVHRLFSLHTVNAAGSEYVRSFSYLFAQSARPLSYLLPASTHPVFGDFTKDMFGTIFYGRGSIEQTLYLGWGPLLLAYFAFRQWRHKRIHHEQYPGYLVSNENFFIGFFIFSAWLAFVFSMPPTIDLGVFKIYFPSYYTYKLFPMFRAYARFGIFVMLCVSILAGYGIKYILERLKTKKSRVFFSSLVFMVVLFEFTNIPPFRVADLTKVPAAYQWLRDQPGDFIIAEYPMTVGSSGEAQENYDYLYYQTIHQKRLINGAPMGTPGFEIKKKILQVTVPGTLKILKSLGVTYVLIHTDLYRAGVAQGSEEVIGEVPRLQDIPGYRLIKSYADVAIYDIVT